MRIVILCLRKKRSPLSCSAAAAGKMLFPGRCRTAKAGLIDVMPAFTYSDFELVARTVVVVELLCGLRVVHELLDDRVPLERTVELFGDVAEGADRA